MTEKKLKNTRIKYFKYNLFQLTRYLTILNKKFKNTAQKKNSKEVFYLSWELNIKMKYQ